MSSISRDAHNLQGKMHERTDNAPRSLKRKSQSLDTRDRCHHDCEFTVAHAVNFLIKSLLSSLNDLKCVYTLLALRDPDWIGKFY